MTEIVVVLNNVRSVYNVGSVFRTCDAALIRPRATDGQAGVKKIYLVGVTPTPLDRFGKFRKDFSKVALGAEKTVEWEYFKNFGAAYKKLRSASGRTEILAVEQDKRSVPYYTISRSRNSVVKKVAPVSRETRDKCALIFGEETKGLSKPVLDKCDKILEIPMRGRKESLNVSVAAGIVIYSLIFEK